ncbi:PilX N-terminal domain-containing pilus assembly protein [Lysinibacillus pakistanensis]|uniref:PilX N-terminal domain-containing pilus assembly protein n=1 Tax=Lysinibacillus pakistanensis TaxID=759811 RepID=UPI003D2A0E89
MRNRNYFNERGYTFIIALLLIVLISVLGFSLITITSNTLKVTTHERADQSVFYIAEADLNVKRAEINQELESVLIPILNKYNNDENFDMDKDRNKIDEEYIEAADFFLTKQLTLEDGKWQKKYTEVTNYEKQNGLQPSSQVTLIKENQQYTYTLRSIAEIDGISRTISQTFTIKTPSFTKKDSEDEETPPTTNYNFCYGILTNSFETKNTLNTDSDIVSLNDLIINNTGSFENIYSKGSITFTNTATINGDVISLNDITIKNGAIFKKDIIAQGNIIVNGGSPESFGNIFSMGNINLQVGISATKTDGFVYADKNFLNGHGSTINGVIFGKESVKDTTNWATGLGSRRYSLGDIIYNKGNSKNNIKAESEAKFNQYLADERVDFNYYLNKIKNLSSAIGSTNNNECGNQSLANAHIPQAPPFLSIDSSSFIEIPDIALSWNSPDALSLTDNSYIKNMSLLENRTLTIDVGDKDRTLVIDNLNGSNGHLRVQGTGKLNILVRNKLSLVITLVEVLSIQQFIMRALTL